MPRSQPQVVIRHEFCREGGEEVQAGLQTWAKLVAQHLRRGGAPGAQAGGPGGTGMVTELADRQAEVRAIRRPENCKR